MNTLKRLGFLGGSVVGLLAAQAQPPAWWSEYQVLSGSADDYAAANIGQLKYMAKKAADAMYVSVPGGVGNDINALFDTWANSTNRDDYAAVNLGQLKYVGQLFYDRLDLTYPWTPNDSTDDDDYALANLGQLKKVFSFDLAEDADHDGMADYWEGGRWTEPG